MNYKIFSCCKLVRGYKRSIIYDLQRSEFHFIPNPLYEILTEFENKSIESIKENYEETTHPIIDEYFQYLFEKELAFICDEEELDSFPKIDMSKESPCMIENFILDINKTSNHNYEKIFESLSEMILKVVQLRFFYKVDLKEINKIISLINNTDIRTIELIIPNNHTIDFEEWIELTDKNSKITTITIYDSPECNIKYNKQATLLRTNETVTFHFDCGKISKDLFSCNMKLYSESLEYNTCLNTKASIDVNGEIRNCPSMDRSFGNYKDVSLTETVKTIEFQKLWQLKKDDIEVCKDCEFRYMCTDCRAYIKNKNNIYSQPSKCSYNPYIAKWENEEGYYPVETGIGNL